MFRCKHDFYIIEEDYIEIDFPFEETLSYIIESTTNDLIQTNNFCKLQFTYISQNQQSFSKQQQKTVQFGRIQPANEEKMLNLRLLSLRCLKCKKKFRFSSTMLKKILDVIRVEHKKDILDKQSFSVQIQISS